MTPLLLRVDDEIALRQFDLADAETMFNLILQNRTHLDTWLRWSGRIQTLQDTQALIQRFAEKSVQGDGFHAGLWYKNELAGGVVCHFINRESHKTEIGYWLAEQYVGYGLVTRACRAVIGYLFEREKMHRVEIQAAVENSRSRAIAERLGFTLEGIKRQSDWLTNRYADHAMYSLLIVDNP
ncbi:MAG: GNAT family N-acetyltransferase [Chloroflexi bacterium]|nr:GNAT family N-acetyltransferase [Chloroflexota bacterium]